MSDECVLVSNSSRFRTTITLVAAIDKVVMGSLRVESDFWPQQSDSSGLSRKYEVEVYDISFNLESIARLRDDLKRWLESQSPFQRRITADRTDDQIEVAFLEESELLSSASKPCFRLYVSAIGMSKLVVEYLVDESCIRMFQNHLSLALEGL